MPSINKVLQYLRKWFTQINTGRGWRGTGHNMPSRYARMPAGINPNPGLRPATYAVQPTKKFTPEEVQLILREAPAGERTRLVIRQASALHILLDERMVRFFRGRERIFERLPYVVMQYTQGKPTQEIARSVSFFSDGEDVEQAVKFAARLIANYLNRNQPV